MSDPTENDSDRYRWYDPRRCLYTILLSREMHPDLPINETPYAHVDAKLILSSAALYGCATLPVFLVELLLEPTLLKFQDEVRPRHAIGYVFEDQWAEITKMLAIYPFGVVFDLRNRATLIETPPGHIALHGHEVTVETVVRRWIEEGQAALDRVRNHWPEEIVASLQEVHALLKQRWPVRPSQTAAPSVNQDCLRPLALIRNLARGYWGDEVWRQPVQPAMDLSDHREVQRAQMTMADEIIAQTKSARNDAKPEALLIVPAVNPALVAKLFTRMRAKGFRGFEDALLQADGYLLYVDPAEVENPQDREVVEFLMSMRGHEKTFYDAVATTWAAAGRNIVFRTPHLRRRFFDSLGAVASIETKETTITRTMNRWERYCSELTEAVGEEQLRWVSERVDRLMLFSDLPIEWCRVGGVPLGFLLPVSRIPLAPGNLPVRLLVDPLPPTVWHSVESVRILVVDGHDDTDPFHKIPPVLSKIVGDLGFHVDFERIRSTSDLETALARHKPNILYLSTHGGLTRELGGALALPDGPSSFAFELPYAPDVAIVSACRSDPVVNTYSSPARNLFGAGVRSVLASYLNLTEPHAFTVATGLFANLWASLRGQAPAARTWEQLVWMTLNSRRPVDILIAALHRMHRKVPPLKAIELFHPLSGVFAKYIDIHQAEGVPFCDTWHLVPERLRRVARGTEYEEVIGAVTRENAFRPESMFYTQIGEPQRILLRPLMPRDRRAEGAG